MAQGLTLLWLVFQVFCPLCEDCYCPNRKYQDNIDGAFFGTTFPHMFLMTYPHLKPSAPPEPYVPKVFGFRLHHTALGRPPPNGSSPDSRISIMVRTVTCLTAHVCC